MTLLDPAALRLLRPARRDLVTVVVASGVQSLLVIAQAFAVAAMIVALTRGDDLWGWGAVVTAVVAARAAVGWLGDAMAARAAATVGVSIRRQVLARALDLGPQWLAARSTGSLVALATRGVSAIEPYLTRYLPALLLAVTLPLLTVVAIGTQDLLSAVIVVATLPLVPAFAALIGWVTQARAQRQWRELAVLAGHFLDVVSGLPTLVAFRRADHQTATIRAITHRHRRATLDTLRLSFASSAVLELIATISVALVAVSVGLRLAAGHLDLRTALVVLLLAPEAYWPLRRVGAEFHAAAEGNATFADVSALLAEEPAWAGGTSVVDLRRAVISLHDVSVTYPARACSALAPVTVAIAPGELVAVAGPSGAGKSTLLSVLASQLAATGGRVEIGGVPLAEVERRSLMEQVAWHPQRPWIATGTVADNVRLGRLEATEAEVWAALRRVGLADVVTALPGGLAADVAEDGRALSAGQRARLALARVVVADRPVALLDEPTAHLDVETEAVVLATLRWLAERSTVVVVAHRQAVLDIADRVVVLAAAPAPVASHRRVGPGLDPRPPPRPPTAGGREAAEDAADAGGGVRLWLGMALGAGAATAGVALTATAGWLIVRASERPPVLVLLVAIVAVRTFGIARPLLRYLERLVSHDAALRTLADKRAQVYSALVPLTPAALGRRRGDVLAGVVDDVDAFVDRRLRVLSPVATAAAVAVAAVVAAWLLDGRSALVLATALLLAGGGSLAGSRLAVSRAEADFVDRRAELSHRVTEVLRGSAELTAWGAAPAALDAVDDAGTGAASCAVRSSAGAAAARWWATLVLGVAVAATALVVASGVGTTVTPALAALLVLIPLGLLDVVTPLADAGAISARSERALHRLDETLAARPAVVEPQEPVALPLAPSRTRDSRTHGRSVELRDATLGWGATPVVAGLDLDIRPGRRVGVVGPSGSGKSTLAAALLRFLDPLDGTIALDGCDLRQLRTADVRGCVGLVDDDPHIFASTLAENVRLARPEASDEDVQAVLDRAHLGAWSRSLPAGLGTFVGDGAAAVSGGERARIALARSLLADQPVLVLDEPTAHLDAATARAVIADLFDASGGRSVIVISHRREDLEQVDQVLDLAVIAARTPKQPLP